MPSDSRNAYLFSTLSDEQLFKVSAMSQEIRLRDGEELFEFGDDAERFYLVKSGQMKLFRLSAEGNEKIIELIQPGRTFAEALMFLESPTYPVSASAVGDSVLYSFDNKRFVGLLRESVDTCFRLMADMSQRLRALIREIDELTLQNATSRISCMFLRFYNQTENDHFMLTVPKGVLASRLSVKPETFSRIVHFLSDEGVISIKGNHVTVLDAPKLREIAHIESLIGLEDQDDSPKVNRCPITGGKGCV